MELTQHDKDHILAQERYRLEAVRQLDREYVGCKAFSFHRGGFWRGFVLGLILSAFVALLLNYQCRRYGTGYGACYGNHNHGCFQGDGWDSRKHFQDPGCRD